MSANDGEVIKRDEFLHFYHLRKSKDPSYYEFKPWDRASRLILDYPSSLWNWKPNFFFISGSGWCVFPVFQLLIPSFMSDDDRWLTCVFVCSFPVSSSEEMVSASSWKSEGVLGVRQRFWQACFPSISISSLFVSRTVYYGSEEFGSCKEE